ncbi:tRNA (adenosine(37)-N6)-threonylcarbamoyltransferase complex ATPase subunit type 1 TsaE [Chitinophaga japonensis]|nr:tRNA (adenosine(37)-N6)-threonylcarbamoyltransferase complex ATPase subunit type 1 TsaE [Chitinophaga japonensis]
MHWTFTEPELPQIAQAFWAHFKEQRVFTLEGEMGAGKTTFIKALCAAKGVEDATASPTFAIINQYVYHNGQEQLHTIYHLDLYRLRDEEEAIAAGIEDTLYQEEAVCFVEWPGIITRLLPKDTVNLHLEVLPDQRRRLTVQ